MSTRYKPRGVSQEHLDILLQLRKSVRDAIRAHYPDAPRPSGRGWITALAEIECPQCPSYLFLVHVPDLPFAQLVYCPNCRQTMELAEGEGEDLP